MNQPFEMSPNASVSTQDINAVKLEPQESTNQSGSFAAGVVPTLGSVPNPSSDSQIERPLGVPTNYEAYDRFISPLEREKQTALESISLMRFKDYCVWCGTLVVYGASCAFYRCPVCTSANAVDVQSHVQYIPGHESLDLVSQCRQWSTAQVVFFLRSLNCDNNTISCLSMHNIDGPQLLNLSASDLLQIGVKNEDQITKLLGAIAQIKKNALISAFSSHYQTTTPELQQMAPPVNAPLPHEIIPQCPTNPNPPMYDTKISQE